MLGQFQMRNFASKHESMDKLIGRDKEHAELERCLNSDRSELVIVYGRRRIGKTFLIEEFFDREFDFKYVGPQTVEQFPECAQQLFGKKVLPFKQLG